MQHWLEQYPALRIMQKQIAATDYNSIRLGLLHNPLPWRLPLKQIRCMCCLLDKHAWVAIDECQNDQPILAWTNFKLAERNALDAPVECELHLFHMHAGLIMGKVLDTLQETVLHHNKK